MRDITGAWESKTVCHHADHLTRSPARKEVQGPNWNRAPRQAGRTV